MILFNHYLLFTFVGNPKTAHLLFNNDQSSELLSFCDNASRKRLLIAQVSSVFLLPPLSADAGEEQKSYRLIPGKEGVTEEWRWSGQQLMLNDGFKIAFRKQVGFGRTKAAKEPVRKSSALAPF